MNTSQIISGRYVLDGTSVADVVTGELYAFETYEYAKAFFDILVKYERSKLDENLLISSSEFTGKWKTVPSNIIGSVVPSAFIFNLGGDEYKLSLANKPNVIQRFMLRLLGFKRV
jgi:hypothetical protein